jgi:membrane protein
MTTPSHASSSSPPQAGRRPGEAAGGGRFARASAFAVRLAYAILLKFRDSALHVESTSLAYRTLLSLVPLLAVMFSVLKGFGVKDQLAPFLERSFEPLGDQGPEIAQNILGFVDNLNFAVLGYAGLVLLFWTVVSLLSRVEEAFDAIWEVPARRSLLQRFSTYLSVTLVGPVLLAAAFGTMTEAMQDALVRRPLGFEWFGSVISWVGGLLPHLLVWLAFAFLYAFMTNARVRPVPALAGALFASVAWFAVGRLFAEFVAGSAQYSAIYSGFAAAVLFVIWLNVGWLITLVGAQVACYWQWPERLERAVGKTERLEANAPTLALEAMLLIARSHEAGGSHWTAERLARVLGGAPVARLDELMAALGRAGLVVATAEQPAAYVPARAPAAIGLAEIVAAAGIVGGAARLAPVHALGERISAAVNGALEGLTLQDLLAMEGGAPRSAGQPEVGQRAVGVARDEG